MHHLEILRDHYPLSLRPPPPADRNASHLPPKSGVGPHLVHQRPAARRLLNQHFVDLYPPVLEFIVLLYHHIHLLIEPDVAALGVQPPHLSVHRLAERRASRLAPGLSDRQGRIPHVNDLRERTACVAVLGADDATRPVARRQLDAAHHRVMKRYRHHPDLGSQGLAKSGLALSQAGSDWLL